ncbi:phage minor capsid protein [Slackia exigua]|uniref:phage minor capsid protein n=1 Tax=Slackia exigua TaxID=84109 RepID=UPI0023F3DDD4|nr:phage minor capsid protein [Slackia exigua]
MALSDADVLRLADQIVHGAEERMVAAMADALVDALSEGVIGLSGETALETLADADANLALSVLAEHAAAIDKEVRGRVEAALSSAASSDESALASAYAGSSAAAADAAAARSERIASLSRQTAAGVADIVRRRNLAMAANSQRLWIEVAAEAVTGFNLGLVPREELTARAVSRLMAEGLETIDYASGVRSQLDVAIRRHIVTQASQAGGRMAMETMRAYGHRLVVTSSHYGARPSHAEWQGLPCSMDGPAVVDGVPYPGLVELTGYGTVGGLKGANCRHSINPYFPGVTPLPARSWPEHERRFGMTSKEYYEATQRQRELERRVRRTKREIAGMERAGVGLESPTYVQKRLVLGRQQKALREHCGRSGLVRQYAREKAYGVSAQPRALRTYSYWSGGTRRQYVVKDISSFEKKYRGTTGREVGMVFDENGNDIEMLAGKDGHSIRFSLPKGRSWRDVYVAHTHPDEYGGTFSVDDMYFLTDSGIRGLYAVCNEGTYSLSPGPKGKPRSLMRAYDAAYLDALDKHGSDLVAIRKTLHGWLSKNASSYGFSYVFKEVQ